MDKIRTAASTLLLFALAATPLLSHDFWLIPNAFEVAQGEKLTVLGQTSSEFPTTLSAVTPDRIADARLVMSGSSETIESLGVSENSLVLTHRPGRAGQAIVAVRIHPRSIPESPESFRHYLQVEGAPEALARYEREGLLPTDSILRRYAKYAKTLVSVGRNGGDAYSEVVGHPLEFVPLSDPESTAPGGTLRFRMLLGGEPVAGARGHASVATSADAASAYDSVEFETDAAGELSLRVSGTGIWNVRALYIVPAPQGSGADWDVHWATFVWRIEG